MESLIIGSVIKNKRKELGMTQEECASALGVTKAAVSKWENAETYPDITLLPSIADLFSISIDSLLRENTPNNAKPICEYHFSLVLSNFDSPENFFEILDHCKVVSSKVFKAENDPRDIRNVSGKVFPVWEVAVEAVSVETDFPCLIQKHINPGVLIDGYSVHKSSGGIICDDGESNKHYICREKIWEYHNTDRAYLYRMLHEQIELGLIDAEDTF